MRQRNIRFRTECGNTYTITPKGNWHRAPHGDVPGAQGKLACFPRVELGSSVVMIGVSPGVDADFTRTIITTPVVEILKDEDEA